MSQVAMRQAGEGPRPGKTADILLVCGILSSLVYVASDILAAVRYEGYSYIHQAFSELSAIGAPTRPMMVALSPVYNLLVIAFGIGVLRSAGRRRFLRITGILLIVYGVVSGMGPFVPMHQRGAGVSFTDTAHVIATGVISLLTLLYIGLGAAADGRSFRLYSILTILMLVVFGALAGRQGPRVAANLPTPWFGVLERVNIYGSLLWVLVLAVVLLRARAPRPAEASAPETSGIQDGRRDPRR